MAKHSRHVAVAQGAAPAAPLPRAPDSDIAVQADPQPVAAFGARNLVRMSRPASQHPEPHTADVHPDEVENYRVGGWVEA
jgi:hypothetical protein